MAGLVTYVSSDEEDVQKMVVRPAYVLEHGQPTLPANGKTDPLADEASPQVAKAPTSKSPPAELPRAPIIGPATRPSKAPHDTTLAEPDAIPKSVPQSPYSTERSRIRSLTLPSHPIYDLPPSTPGSPAPSTNSKFEQFLALKKRGVHFNEKLASSSAMKNPGLFEKLMDFAGVGEAEQYANTSRKEVWDPGAVPQWAWKEELGRSQQKVQKQRDEEARGVEFVPAVGSAESIRSGTSSVTVGQGIGQKSAAERVMAGLEGGRSNSPQVQGQRRRARFGPDVGY